MYGGAGTSEEFLGQALKGRREEVVLATKFGHQNSDMGYGAAAGAKGGRAYIRRAVEESLRRLQTDYIDLYQLHTPDPATPIAETLAALSELVREGKVRYIGHSNLAGWQIAEAAHVARETGAVPFVSAQNEWSLLERTVEQEVVPASIHYGLGVLPYFPLANGLLTGKVRRATGVPEGSRLASRPERVSDALVDTVERLAAWGEAHGRSVLEIGIGALAARPGCGSVIAGATSAEQVRANAAAGAWVPTAGELAEIDAALRPADAQ
jgi:aryl-alcohol dehydrogenase-like predicted oxidoreductase